jgi:hypothetical protein
LLEQKRHGAEGQTDRHSLQHVQQNKERDVPFIVPRQPLVRHDVDRQRWLGFLLCRYVFHSILNIVVVNWLAAVANMGCLSPLTYCAHCTCLTTTFKRQYTA